MVLGLALAASWFLWMRPTTLGGHESYVVVQGSSMEPTYHDGDLVVVREEEHYAKGDIIAFRAGGHFDDPTRVIHRIVGDAGDGAFVTRGDNRDSTDPWQPKPDHIIGRAILHVPRVGAWAVEAGRPEVLAALGGGAVILGDRKRRRRRRRGGLRGRKRLGRRWFRRLLDHSRPDIRHVGNRHQFDGNDVGRLLGQLEGMRPCE